VNNLHKCIDFFGFFTGIASSNEGLQEPKECQGMTSSDASDAPRAWRTFCYHVRHSARIPRLRHDENGVKVAGL
jgi:hypothetical protein